MLCIVIVVVHHLQIAVAVMGFAKTSVTAYLIYKYPFFCPFVIFHVQTEFYFFFCMAVMHHKHDGMLPFLQTPISKWKLS